MMVVADRLHVDHVRPAWRWGFAGEGELRRALEEYAAFTLDEYHAGDGGDPDPEKMDRGYRLYSQNLAINAGMRYIGVVSPYAWTLLDRYYRKGLWGEFRGWAKVSRRLGLPVPDCPSGRRCRVSGDDRYELPVCDVGRSCQWDRDTFEVQLGLAIAALFFALQFRQGRTG